MKEEITFRMGVSTASLVALILLAVTLIAMNINLANSLVVISKPVAIDFYSRWLGARAYFLQGLNPYSGEVSEQIQRGIYGRPAQPGEDQFLFAYPFYTAFVIVPLAILPYTWAVTAWLAILEFCLLGGFWLILDIHHWWPPPGLLAFMGLWTVLFYPHGRGLLLGQFAIPVFFLLALAVWGLARGHDGLAGVALALATIKPQVVILVIPFLLWWGGSQRRWRFIEGFGLALATLIGASFLALPGWLDDFAMQVVAYPGYTTYPPYILTSLPWVLTHLALPTLGTLGETAITLVLLIGLAWAWWREARSDWATFHWTLGLTLIVTNLIALRTTTTNYVVFLLVLVPLFRHIYRRAGAGALIGMQLTLLLGLWVLFWARGAGVPADLITFVAMPPLMLLALFWGRKALARPLQGMEGRETA
ncbi:MAG: hypothetical protein C4309_13475 [Chloroflexota bacterium]